MARHRRFFLDRTPDEGPPELAPADREHALKVLRISAGERLLGLDGCGHAWELEVLKAERRALELRATGQTWSEPPPGAPGAPLPWIEVWAPLPKGGRAEDLLDALTQIGVARFVPLLAARSEVQARSMSSGRRERLERVTRTALKQSGRLWMPEVAEEKEFMESLPGPATRFWLDREAPESLSAALTAAGEPAWTREQPLALWIGPEGGWTEEEIAALTAAGATSARLGPHVLRLETAALAALAVVVGRLSRPPARGTD